MPGIRFHHERSGPQRYGPGRIYDWRDSAMRQPALEASRRSCGCWKYEQIYIISTPRGLNASVTPARRPQARLGRLTVQCALSWETRSVSVAEKRNWRPAAMAKASMPTPVQVVV